jgi:hypothetical protein
MNDSRVVKITIQKDMLPGDIACLMALEQADGRTYTESLANDEIETEMEHYMFQQLKQGGAFKVTQRKIEPGAFGTKVPIYRYCLTLNVVRP